MWQQNESILANLLYFLLFHQGVAAKSKAPSSHLTCNSAVKLAGPLSPQSEFAFKLLTQL